MDKNSKRNLLIAVVIIAIIAIIIILVSIFGGNDNDSTDGINPYTEEEYLSESEVQEKIEEMDIYENLDIVVNNLYDFVKVYDGDLETKDYTEYIKNLNSKFKVLYDETSELSAKEIDSYFEENADVILADYGIETSDEFDMLLDYISIYETNELAYSDVTLEKDTVTDEGDYVKTKVNITYSNDTTKIIYISVLKDTSTGNPEFVLSF